MENCEKIEKEVRNPLHFWQLTDRCMFWLDSQFWDEIFLYKKTNFEDWNGFSNALGINQGTLRNYLSQKSNVKKAQFIPLETLIKISSFVEIPLDKVESYVILAKYGFDGKPIKIKFPINFLTAEWAGLVGALLSEGHMSKNLDLAFWNKDKEAVDKFMELSGKLAPNLSSLIRHRDAYKCSLPRIVSQILISGLSFHQGDKVTADPCLPSIYMNLDLSIKENKEIVCSLLSWLFTGDGWVSLFKDHFGRTHRHMGIGFSVMSNGKAPRLLEDTNRLIKKLGIKPQNNYFDCRREYFKKDKKYITESWKFFINGKENFEIFRDNIGFQDNRRQEVLKKAIVSFVKPNLRKGEPLVRIVDFIVKNPSSNRFDISKGTKISKDRTSVLLRIAKNKGFIELMGVSATERFYRRKAFLYSPTEKGKEFIVDNIGRFE